MSFLPSGAPVLAPFVMKPEEAVAFLEQNALPPYTSDERYLQLDRYEAHWRGCQYDHQSVDWWGMNADDYETVSPRVAVPQGFVQPAQLVLNTRQKRPSIETGACATVVEGYTDLMMSEQAAPRTIVEGDPDTEAMLLALQEKMHWLPKWTHARDLGGAVGSVLVTVAARAGQMDMEVHNTKCVVPLWRNRRQLKPAAVLIFKVVVVQEDELDDKDRKTGNKTPVEYVHRRIISEAEDVVYRPIKASDPNTWDWVRVEALCSRHDLGVFPGVWIQNTAADDDKDGLADCEGAWKTVDALDRLLSQVNKGELATVDPSLVISDDPKMKEAGPVSRSSDNTVELSEKGTAKFLEVTGTGLASAMSFAEQLERWISRRTGYVFAEPDKVAGAAASSLAIRLMFRPMIQRADKKRGQYGPAMVELLKVVEKIVRGFAAQRIPLPPAEDGRERVGVPTLELDPRRMPDGTMQAHRLGKGGVIQVKWGPYFNKGPAEEGVDITNAVAAKNGGLIDRRTAASHVAESVFQVRDLDAMLAKVETEQASEVDAMMAAAGGGVTGVALADLQRSSSAAGGQNGAGKTPLLGKDHADLRKEAMGSQGAGDSEVS